MYKVKIIVNKTWETAAVVEAMTNSQFAAKDLPAPVFRDSPPAYTRGAVHIPRLVFELDDVAVEVWCLEDQMDPAVSGSSTSEKVRVLEEICDSVDDVQLIVPVGTAGSIVQGFNGCVMVGGQFYNHAGQDPSNRNPWSGEIKGENYMDRVIDGCAGALAESLAPPAHLTKKFLSPPRHAAATELVRVDCRSIAVSDVNIIDYRQYTSQDPLAVAAAERHANGAPLATIETTHGVIAAAACAYAPNANYLFVSAITDSLRTFDVDVGPQPEAQDFSAAFNAGVYLGNVLVPLARDVSALARG